MRNWNRVSIAALPMIALFGKPNPVSKRMEALRSVKVSDVEVTDPAPLMSAEDERW